MIIKEWSLRIGNSKITPLKEEASPHEGKVLSNRGIKGPLFYHLLVIKGLPL